MSSFLSQFPQLFVATLFILNFKSPLFGKGLDTLTPPSSGQNSNSQETKVNGSQSSPSQKPGTIAPNANPSKNNEDKTAQKNSNESNIPQFTNRFFMGTSLSWLNLSGNKGGWHSAMNSDLIAGFQMLRMLNEKLILYGTLRYLPIDVIAKYEGQEYQGIVENVLFGSLLGYRLASRLDLDAGFEIGLSKTSLDPLDTQPLNQDLEKTGGAVILSSGLVWRMVDQLRIGGRVYLGTGTFNSIQIAANVSFSL